MLDYEYSTFTIALFRQQIRGRRQILTRTREPGKVRTVPPPVDMLAAKGVEFMRVCIRVAFVVCNVCA